MGTAPHPPNLGRQQLWYRGEEEALQLREADGGWNLPHWEETRGGRGAETVLKVLDVPPLHIT